MAILLSFHDHDAWVHARSHHEGGQYGACLSYGDPSPLQIRMDCEEAHRHVQRGALSKYQREARRISSHTCDVVDHDKGRCHKGMEYHHKKAQYQLVTREHYGASWDIHVHVADGCSVKRPRPQE